ncbi:MAG: peptidase dimerization domain-containing protein, partial [Butyricicoccaceae bacterium]
KAIHITGKSSHAAIAPHEGINAQDVAATARTAVALQRSTFQERDCVRVAELVSLGSNAVNVIPGDADVDIQVRAKTRDAMLKVNRMITRCYEGAAHAFGAQVDIRDSLGYLPVLPSAPVPELNHAAELLQSEVSFEPVDLSVHNAASTDVGDLTHRMPVVNFTFGGFSGTLHGADFTVTDPYKGLIVPAKIAALTIYGLMRDNAAGLRRVIASYHAPMSHQDYLDYVHTLHPELFV